MASKPDTASGAEVTAAAGVSGSTGWAEMTAGSAGSGIDGVATGRSVTSDWPIGPAGRYIDGSDTIADGDVESAANLVGVDNTAESELRERLGFVTGPPGLSGPDRGTASTPADLGSALASA